MLKDEDRIFKNLYNDKGADVQYSDPYLPESPKARKFNFDLKSIDLQLQFAQKIMEIAQKLAKIDLLKNWKN